MSVLDLLRRPEPGEPAHRQIEEQLRALIAEGSLAPGDRIPPERELAARLAVSRMTLRQALDALARRGLLVRAGGRGTFVASRRVAQDLRVLRTYPEEVAGQGMDPTTELVRRVVEPADAGIADELDLPVGAPLLLIERLRSADGEPVVLETSWLSAARFPSLVDGPLGDSLWDALARLGARVVRAEERLEPVLARAVEARALGVPPGAPVMRVERLAFAADGRPVEYAVGSFRGDRTRFIVEVAISGAGGAPRPPDDAQ